MTTPTECARRVLVFAALVFAFALPAGAQVGGGSTDIIVGQVVGPDSAPVAGARVTIVSTVTNATRTVLTRPNGRFTVLFRDGGGRYRIVVTFLGMQPAELPLQRRADEDRLIVTVRMSTNPQQLSTVEVRERPEVPRGAFSGGSRERTFLPELLERLPFNPGDLLGTATLVPGVVATPASDTSRSAFSVAAQPAVQNNITLDGMTFLFGSIPQDAVRETRVILNSYDVARGQFTGGQLATTSKSGPNRFEGTVNFTARPKATQFVVNRREGDAFARKYSQGLLTTGLGGPVGKSERAFYFVSAEVENRVDPTLSLSTARNPTLLKLGLQPDSLAQFRGVLNALGAAPAAAAPLEQTSASGSVLGRLDVDIDGLNQLMLRVDGRRSRQEGIRVSPYASPSSGGTTNGIGGGAMVMLTSLTGGGQFINEFRAYSSWEREESDPYLRAPTGVVTVTSALDESRQLAALQFGGSPFLPRTNRATIQEASDELSWLSERAGHRVKLGVMVNRERAEITGVTNRYGTYVYNSLADLAASTPALYTRTVAGSEKLVGTDNAAVYIANAWQKTSSLQLTYGVRVEASRLADAPEFNAIVAAAIDRSTRSFLNEFRVSPRLGLTYLLGNVAGVPSGTLRMGFGEFRGRIPSHLLQYVNANAGFASSQGQVSCAGNVIPTADWATFSADTLSIPTRCAGNPALGSPLASSGPNIAVWGEGAGAPRVWRTSMSFERRVFTRYALGIDALYAHGVHNPAATDLNLVTHETSIVPSRRRSSFTLPNEGRPVFTLPVGIVDSTGAISLAASRHFPFFGSAFDFGSGVSSRTGQLTLQFSGAGNSWGSMTVGHFSLGYTLQRARDQSNGYAFHNALGNTAGDPRRKEWGTSDLERRHSVVGTALLAFPRSLELSFIVRAMSGPRYTPMVSGDVNADGVRNDRAYVFSNVVPMVPAVVDPAITAGMQRLTSHADERTRRCLTGQMGHIAARNSCTTQWHSALDLQLNWRPAAAKLDRRVTFSLVALNALAGIDQLVHGSANMKGWGQESYPDRALLHVTGFDATARTFRYTVNEHFGSRSGATNPIRQPFQLGLQVHVQLGTDPRREAWMNMYGTRDGRPPSASDLKERLSLTFPLPIKMALAAADSLELGLTLRQRMRLLALNDSVTAQVDTLLGTMAEVLAKAGANPDLGAISPRIQRTHAHLLRVVQQSATDLKSILEPWQWELLPDAIKFPLDATAPTRPIPQLRP